MKSEKIRKIQILYSIYIIVFFLSTALSIFLAIKTPELVTYIFNDFTKDVGAGVLFMGFFALFLDFIIILIVLALNFVMMESFIVSIIGIVKISKATRKRDMIKLAKWEVKNKICRIPGKMTLDTEDCDYSKNSE